MTESPQPLVPMYPELSTELHELSNAWRYVHDMTRDMFSTDTLNRASAAYFDTVLRALFAYGLVLLARLLDHPQTGKRQNCSLAALAETAGRLDMVGVLDDIRTGAERLLEYRNKQVAHLDRILTLQAEEDQPQLFTWVGMHETLEALQRWMNEFEKAMNLPLEHYIVEEEWTDVDEIRSLLRKGMSA